MNKIDKKSITIVIFISLFLVAGCLGYDSGENNPPGTNGDSIDNATVLVDSHRSILDKNEYVLSAKIENSWDGESQVLYLSDTSNKTAIYQVTNDDDYSATVFFNQDGWYKRSDNFLGVDYEKGGPEGTFEKYNSEPTGKFGIGYFNRITYLENTIRDYEYSWENNTAEGNKTYTKFKITGHKHRDDSVNGYIFIRDDGFIREFVVNDGRGKTEIKYEIRQNLDVNQPRWINKADSQSTGGVGGDYDCDDFSSQASAQAVHEESGGAHGLDGDGDGIACEALP